MGRVAVILPPPAPAGPPPPFFPPSSPCPLPGAQAECSVRRVSTEHPLCVLTKAECPGDKRGRSGLRAHKARGRRGLEEVEGRGRRRGGGGGGGEICWGLNRPTQPPKNSWHPKKKKKSLAATLSPRLPPPPLPPHPQQASCSCFSGGVRYTRAAGSRSFVPRSVIEENL